MRSCRESVSLRAMESEATFRQRALPVGILEGDLQMLGDKGVNTFSTFAFCAPTQNPQSIDERPLLEALTELLELTESYRTGGSILRVKLWR